MGRIKVIVEFTDGHTEEFRTEHYRVSDGVLSICRLGYHAGSDHFPLVNIRRWSTE